MMTLEGAIKFSENNHNTIYTMNSSETGQYCIIIPNNIDGELSMLVDMNMKPIFDSLIANTITKEELIEKVNEEYKYVSSKYPHGILVLPMLDKNILANSIANNDKQKMFDETKKIGGITSEIYKKLTETGVDKSKINQKIIILETNENDIKFVAWLKEQMPNFVDGVSLDSLKPKTENNNLTNNNPFASINPFTVENNNEAPKEEKNSEESNDIFGPAPISTQSAPTNEKSPIQPNNNIFDSSLPKNEEPAPKVEPTSSIQEPQPVQSTNIESLPPINPTPTITAESTTEPQSEEVELDKKSGGFANLLILLVILIGVTIVSIELGKFLYNTYGV